MMKFYKCDHCGQIITKVVETGAPVMCCEEPMKEMVAGESDGAREKHVPVYSVANGQVDVKVGEVIHPMLENHYIAFIVLETNKGAQIKNLKPGEEPCAKFNLVEGEEVIAVYEYCNLHGLFKA